MNAQITRSDQDCVAPGFGALNRYDYPAPLISTLKPWGGPVEEEPVLHFLPAFFRSQNSSFTSHLLPLWGSPDAPGTIFRSPWSNPDPIIVPMKKMTAMQSPAVCGHTCGSGTQPGQTWRVLELASWTRIRGKGKKSISECCPEETLPPIQTPAGYPKDGGADLDPLTLNLTGVPTEDHRIQWDVSLRWRLVIFKVQRDVSPSKKTGTVHWVSSFQNMLPW